jgi:hypothetical protein
MPEKIGVSHGQGHLRIDRTAPYSWNRQGRLPRSPIPNVVVSVLSEELGIALSVDHLWPGRGERSDAPETAVAGLSNMRSVTATLQALWDLSGAVSLRSDPLGVRGEDLSAAVASNFRISQETSMRPKPGERVTSAQVDVIAAHVGALRRLDDQQGGGSLSLRYALAEFRSVLDLRHSADLDSPLGRRLMGITIDLAQLVGWMQFDAGRYGPAERHLLLAARLARMMAETGRMVNSIGMLSYVSAFAGHGREATRIAESALEACSASSPLVRARIKGREATAAAVDGDLRRFRSAADEAMSLLSTRADEQVPSFLYYLEPSQLVAESGQALVSLAARRPEQAKRLLREAVELLTPISIIGQRPDYPRSALLHATFLTEAHLRLGNLPEAVVACRAALSRLEETRSGRGRAYLVRLRPAFARRNRNPDVSDFLPELNEALSLA